MKKIKKPIEKASIILTVLMFSSILIIPATFATQKMLSRPIILSIGDSTEINYTINQIKKFIPEAETIQINTIDEFEKIIRETERYIIYVGHGDETGLAIPESKISWKNVEKVIKESSSNTHIMASCYSNSVEVEGKTTFGFSGPVEVDQAALYAVAHFLGANGRIGEIPNAIEYFTKLLTDKVINPKNNYCAYLLTLSYQHETWWALYPGDYQYNVKYTHPDVFTTYTDITAETSASVYYDGFGVTHIPASEVQSAQIDTLLITALGGTAIALLTQFGPVGTLAGIIGTLILALYGGIWGWILTNKVADDSGAGWSYAKNLWSDDWGSGVHTKLGGLGWVDVGFFYGVPYAYPLGYGGTDLGVWGI